MIYEVIFWISAFSLLHTYVFYPLLVKLLARNKENNNILYNIQDDLPTVTIIMAVHNVENIISEKIHSVFASKYPSDKLVFYIGSDASTDNSDNIIEGLIQVYPSINFQRFNQRVGKIPIINHLANKAESELLLFTDAHAIFLPYTIYNLVKHFRNQDIKLAGGTMQVYNSEKGIVSIQERSYFENEFKVKYAEGKLWGCMMGAFGSIYAVRKKSWHPVPYNFLGDDFYITLNAIQHGGRAIFEPEAIVCQKIPGDIHQEYKRKKRIAIGNFQNLSVFYKILFSSRFSLSFSFFSHKILRWFGPFFIFLGIISLFMIYSTSLFYCILFVIMLLSLLVPIIDYFHVKFQIHIVLLRFITHFYYMNIALLVGLFIYLKGVKSNVWEPTKRD